MKRKLVIVLMVLIILNPSTATEATAKTTLSKNQKKTADRIAGIAGKEWEKYGVLPSVAVTQAFIESSLGKNQVRPNNLWGIRPRGEYSSYESIEGGVYGYLRVLNNGRYDKALFKTDYRRQIWLILQGGYYGEDDGGTVEEYYRNCINSIDKYGFDKYDKSLLLQIKKEEKEKKRKKKWRKTYTLIYDATLAEHEAKVDKKIIKKGALKIWKDNEMKGIFDVVKGQKGFNISVPYSELEGMEVNIEVLEDAKG